MALFTDGNLSDIDDLRAYDSSILAVAGSEGVDVDAKLSLASDEIGAELDEFLVRRAGGASGGPREGPRLSQVVVTPPLKQWHTLWTLVLVYGDIRGNHVESRYEAKWKELERRARWVKDSLFRIGVGLVDAPLPKPEKPEVGSAAGPQGPGTYYLRVCWRNSRGESGSVSDLVTYSLTSGGTLVVRTGTPPAGVCGFDVYVGTEPKEVFRQNNDMLEAGTEWRMPEVGPVVGPRPGSGQTPQRYLRNDRVLQRG